MAQDVPDIISLIDKLNHNLSEVRARALKNIVSKLDNGIVCEEDLVTSQPLYKHLLNLVNNQELVSYSLVLLARLTKHSAGAEIVTLLNGVKNITAFCNKNNEQHSAMAQQILDSLFFVHGEAPNAEDALPKKIIEENQRLYYNNNAKEETQHVYHPQEMYSIGHSEIFAEQTNCQQKTYDQYKNAYSQDEYSPAKVLNPPDESPPPVGEMFQFVLLTSGDRQIVTVTETRMTSATLSTVVQACHFFRGVMLHDFPTEVFLQRPKIFKTLLYLLCAHKEKEDIVSTVISCLSQFCASLRKRMIHNSNKDFWQKEQEVHSVSTNVTESSELSEGVKNGESATDLVDDYDSKASTELLMQSKISVVEFAFISLLQLPQILVAHTNNDYLFTDTCNLYSELTHLLSLCAFKQDFWSREDAISKKHIYNAITCLHKFEEVLQQTNENDVKMLLCAKLMFQYIEAAFPDEKVYEVMTDTLVGFCRQLLAKGAVLKLGHMETLIANCVGCADEIFYCGYVRCMHMIKAMQKLDHFLLVTSDEKKHCSVTTTEIIDLTTKLLPWLHIHEHKQFVERSIVLCSKLFLKKDSHKNVINIYQSLVSHANEKVLEIVYAYTLKHLQKSFSVSLVSEPASTHYQSAMFIFHNDIFATLFKVGLNSNKKVYSPTMSTAHLLISSSLNMSVKLFTKLLKNLPEVLPHLQAKLSPSENDPFTKSVTKLFRPQTCMLNANGSPCSLPQCEQVRGALRMMFLNTAKLRRSGFALALLHLSKYTQEKNILYNFAQTDFAQPEELFMVDSVEGLSPHKTKVSKDNLVELWKVFTDESQPEKLVHSAVEQLAIIIEDSGFHAYLNENNAKDVIIQHIENILFESKRLKAFPSNHIRSLIRMLRYIVRASKFVCCVVALKTDVYMMMLQAVLMESENTELRKEASILLAYLLFNDALLNEETQLKSDCLILKSYKLPIRVEATKQTTTEESILRHEELVEYIKVSCFHSCEWIKNTDEDFSELLKISPDDMAAYKNKGVSEGIREIFGRVCSPQLDHEEFLRGVGELQTILQLIHNIVEFKDLLQRNLDAFFQCHRIKRLCNAPLTQANTDELSSVFRLINQARLNVPTHFFISDNIVNIVNGVVDAQSKSLVEEAIGMLTALSRTQRLVESSTLIVAGFKNFLVSGSEEYYDLVLMETVLQFLATLTSVEGWSRDLVYAHDICLEICKWLQNIITSFHADRVGASTSFMGKGIVESAVLCLCHVLHELFQSEEKEEVGWSETSLPWLVALLGDRSVKVRAAAWMLTSAFLQNMAEVVVGEFETHPGGVWALCIEVVLNSKECFFVRTQVCKLMCRLIDKLLESNENVLWNTMVVQDTVSKAELVGVEAFMLLFDHFGLFAQLRVLFERDFSVTHEGCVNATTSISRDNIIQLSNESEENTRNSLSRLSDLPKDTSTMLSRFDEETLKCSSLLNTSLKMESQIKFDKENNAKPNTSLRPEDKNTKNGTKADAVNETDENINTSTKIVAASNSNKNNRDPEASAENKHLKINADDNVIKTQAEKNEVIPATDDVIPATLNSMMLKASVIELVKHVILLAPESILQQMISHGLLEEMFKRWDTESLTKLTNRSDILEHAQVSAAMLEFVDVIRELNFSVLRQLFSGYGLLEKMFSLFSLKYTSDQVQMESYKNLWNLTSIVFGEIIQQDPTVSNVNFDPGHMYLVEAISKVTSATSYKKCACLANLLNLFVVVCQVRQNYCCEFFKYEYHLHHIDSMKPAQNVKASRMNSTRNVELSRTKSPEKITKSLRVGEYLCCLFLHVHTTCLCSPPHVIRHALGALLALCACAKKQALEEGYVDSLIEELKDLQIKIDMCTMEMDGRTSKKQMDFIRNLSCCLEVIGCFCLDSSEIKNEFIQGGIVQYLLSVRIWSAVYTDLSDILLQICVVFSKECPKAQLALCTHSHVASKQALDETCLVNYVIKMVDKLHKLATHGQKNDERTWLCFQVLCNGCELQECRNLIFKANLFPLFIFAYNNCSHGNKRQRAHAKILLSLWWRLLTYLTMHQDGAKYVWSTTEFPRILEETLREKGTSKQALLVARNLTFLPVFKQAIASNDEILSILAEKFTSNSLKIKVIVCSFFWTLLYDNIKAKSILKKGKFRYKLTSLSENIHSGKCLASSNGDLDLHDSLKSLVENIQSLLPSS